MRHKTIMFLTTILLAGLMPGCVTLARHPGFKDVNKAVEARTGIHLEKSDKRLEKELPAKIESLLSEELTIDEAIQIALLNNGALQAVFQELGIAKADLLQAGLLKNPKFHMFTRFPRDEGDPNTEVSITQDVLDLIYMPLRRRVASAQFEQAKLRVSDAVLNLIAEVKTAYYSLQAAEQVQAMQQTVLEAAEAASEIAERQFKAGNIKALDLASEKAAHEQAWIDFIQGQAAVVPQRESLIRLLGLSGEENWRISAELPALPETEPALEDLEERALSQRLDLAAVRKQTDIFRKSLLATRLGIIRDSEFGINWERDTDGERVAGPEWGLDVPIFDWQQAQGARTKAEFRQSQYAATAFEVQVRSEVREARERMLARHKVAGRYRGEIIPLREDIVRFTLEQYNFMLMGVFQLLQARQNEILARRTYIEALKEYWIARTDLERAIGGNLPAMPAETKPAATSPPPASPSPQSSQRHHHRGGGNP